MQTPPTMRLLPDFMTWSSAVFDHTNDTLVVFCRYGSNGLRVVLFSHGIDLITRFVAESTDDDTENWISAELWRLAAITADRLGYAEGKIILDDQNTFADEVTP